MTKGFASEYADFCMETFGLAQQFADQGTKFKPNNEASNSTEIRGVRWQVTTVNHATMGYIALVAIEQSDGSVRECYFPVSLDEEDIRDGDLVPGQAYPDLSPESLLQRFAPAEVEELAFIHKSMQEAT